MLRACKQAFLFLALLSTRLHMSPAMTCLLLFRSLLSHRIFSDSPVCNSSPRKIASVIGSNISIICDVDAFPEEVTFQWWFSGAMKNSQKQMISEHGPTLNHRVKSNEDFGTIYCQARNQVGWQNQPCMFNIHPGGNHRKKERIVMYLLVCQKKNECIALEYRITRVM